MEGKMDELDELDGILDFSDGRTSRREILKKGAVLGAGALIGARYLGSASAHGATNPFPHATDPAWKKVLKAANNEGSVTYYGVNPDMTTALQTYFHRDYPHITLNVYTSSPAGIQAKLLTEYQTGTKNCDVVQSRSLVLPSYQAVGAVKRVFLPNDNRLPAAIQDRKGYFHPMYIAANDIVHNTNVLKTPPSTDLFKLSDPKYKGIIGIDNIANNGPGWFIVASRRATWGPTKWKQWMAGLKANEIRTFSTAGAAYAAVVQGTIAVSTDSYNDVLGQKAGTPAAATWYDGVIPTYLGVSAVANAPNPNAALVFMNWMIGPEGQRQFSHSNRFPTVPPAGALTFLKALPKGATLMQQSKMEPYYQNAASFSALCCTYLQC
jgi:ABC-type Fe3+ transport system substrate-binding protein